MAKGKRGRSNNEPPTEAESLAQIAVGLDRVARAIAISSVKDASDAEQAFHLNQVGFAPSEIAEMYGEKINIITARISNFRKARGKRQKKPKRA